MVGSKAISSTNNSVDNIRLQFHVSDKVSFEYKRQVITGIITRLNPKRAHIIAEDNQEYQIPYKFLTVISKNNDVAGKNRSEAELELIHKLAEELIVEHNLAYWKFQFDNGTKRAGCCNYKHQIISMSYEFARYASDEDIRDTILHEMAHALVGPKHHHDNVWKAKAIEIGCTGERCHDIQFTPPRYIVKCINGCWFSTAERRKRNVICKLCKGEIVFLTYTEQRWQELALA